MSTVVIPPEGKLKETAQLLLSLADEVYQVRTINAGNAFEVPDYVAEAYHDHLSGQGKTKTRGRSARTVKE